ncbi:MAG: class I SAM-dependent methyltransferase [Actinomycetota bacterium]|nr:class I SAM-dependent methyltransferase [Actinomycetota bacterium]
MRVDYDREARHYRAGREVPFEQIEPWRRSLSEFLRPRDEPLLDIGAGTGLWTRAFATWFDAEVIALEPSSGMRAVGDEIGLPSRGRYVAGSAEHLPFGRAAFRAAWFSLVVHHLTDLSACARELRRVLAEGASVMIRNMFPGRLEEVGSSGTSPPLPPWPTLEQVIASFAEAGFTQHRVVRVREERWRDLRLERDWAVSMRNTDSTLGPISDAEFAEGLRSLEEAIARGERPSPTGRDLVVLT